MRPTVPPLLPILIALLAAPVAQAASLEAFLEAARANNPDIAAASARADHSRAGVVVARSALLPSLEVSGGYTRNIPEVKTVLPFGDEPLELVIQPADQLGATAKLTVPLVIPSALAALPGAEAVRDAGEAGRDAATEATLLAVVQAYWTAVAADRIEVAAKESLAASESALAIAKARYDLAGASLLEVRWAEADMARAKQALVDAGAERRDAARRLESLTGLADPPDKGAPPRAAPTGDLAGRAREANPERRLAEATLRASRAGLSLAGWSYAPNIAGFVQAQASNATGFSGQTWTGVAGVQATWTLFDGGGREGRFSQARASVRESEATLERVDRDIDDDVAKAIDDIEAARLLVEAAGLGVTAASASQRLAEEQFRLGAIDASTLIFVRRDAYQAEVQAALADLSLGIAVEHLRFLVGEPL